MADHSRSRRGRADQFRNPIKITQPDGSTVTARYDAALNLPLERTNELGIRTLYEYDAKGNLTKLTEAADKPEQRVTEMTYHSSGQIHTRTVKGATVADDATTTWTWHDDGQLASVTDPEGHPTRYTYTRTPTQDTIERLDARGNTWTTLTNARGWLLSSKNPLGHATTYEYDRVGNRRKQIDALGHVTEYVYTGTNLLKTTIDPLGGRIETSYDKNGRRLAEKDQENVTTRYEYDSSGRITKTIDGANNTITLRYGTALGVEGLLIATDYPTYTEEYKYDQRDRRIQITRVLPNENGAPTRESTTTGYDVVGNRISEVDPLQRATLHAYDHLGRLSDTTDALGGKTRYAYDTRNNLVTVTDANGNTHRFSYDKNDQVLSEARPLGGTIRYTYNETGGLTGRTNHAGERRKIFYDAANRRTEERQYPASSESPSQAVTYTYDRRSLLTSYLQTGDTESSATYVHDAKGQKTEETVTYGAGSTAFSKTTKTDYTAAGQKRGFTYPDNTRVDYTYTGSGLLETASLPGESAGQIHWQAYQWQQPTKIVMPGAVRTMAYDALQRPEHIKSQAIGSGNADAPSGDILMDYRYTYDAAGNIVQRQTEDGAYDYGYDLIDRLTSATPPQILQQDPAAPEAGKKLPVEVYSYDPVHNRLSSQHQPGQWQYNPDNQLQSYGIGAEKRSYTYNPNGHTATEITGDPATKTRTFIYNAAERLSEIKDNNQIIGQYQYDPMGRRIKKQTNEGVMWFLYADEGLIAEMDQAGSPTRYFGWKPNGLWGTDPLWLADKSEIGWVINFYHNDHLWTPQRITDVAGVKVWTSIRESFGQRVGGISVASLESGFPGQYFDEETGIYLNYYRNYSPEIGRYIQLDPFGFQAGVNYYIYALSNPIKRFDNFGLFTTGPFSQPGEHVGGTVICDGYFLTFEMYWNEPCTLDCAMQHEQTHLRDVRARNPGLCHPVNGKERVLASNREEKDWTEHNAYSVELVCLMARDEVCVTGPCEEEIKARIRFVQSMLSSRGW